MHCETSWGGGVSASGGQPPGYIHVPPSTQCSPGQDSTWGPIFLKQNSACLLTWTLQGPVSFPGAPSRGARHAKLHLEILSCSAGTTTHSQGAHQISQRSALGRVWVGCTYSLHPGLPPGKSLCSWAPTPGQPPLLQRSLPFI